jgi:hypothetical protein
MPELKLHFAGFSSLPFLGRQIFFSSSLALDCLLFSKPSGCVFVFGSGYACVTGCSMSSLYALFSRFWGVLFPQFWGALPTEFSLHGLVFATRNYGVFAMGLCK